MSESYCVKVLNGAPMDARLDHENEVLRQCLAMAIGALKFKQTDYCEATMQRIAEYLKLNDFDDSLEAIRKMVKTAS